MFILLNQTSRVIFAGGYRLVPEIPQEIDADKKEFMAMYPRLSSMMDAGEIKAVTKTAAKTATQNVENMTIAHLKEYAKGKGITVPDGLKKDDIVELIQAAG
ncbi:hypothetical protein [uncultured Megasphaera sp.]|uniref:hypothetical protein n=1 Tax=uncultured Megasphaera sp. TaxID=165188 RepID=UPI00265ADBE1|nr:hypothetical protein [uncultured Megasphaera sp.]